MLKEGTKVAEIYSKLVEKGLKDKYDFSGIYCIKIEDKIVYIGKSVNMLERIAQHEFEMKYAQGKLSNKYKVLREAGYRGYLIGFDVMYYTTRKRPEAVMKDIGQKEGVLIRKHKPILNYQIPKVEDWHKYTVNPRALTITLDEILEENNMKSIQEKYAELLSYAAGDYLITLSPDELNKLYDEIIGGKQ